MPKSMALRNATMVKGAPKKAPKKPKVAKKSK